MEFAAYGTLENILSCGAMNKECARYLLGQIILSLKEIHSIGWMHRDLKPANIVVAETLAIKIIDFGEAKEFVNEHSVPTITKEKVA